MRDTLRFPTATKVRYIPQKLVPVPHTGMKQLYADSYDSPSDVKAKEANFCPVDTPFTLPREYYLTCQILFKISLSKSDIQVYHRA